MNIIKSVACKMGRDGKLVINVHKPITYLCFKVLVIALNARMSNPALRAQPSTPTCRYCPPPVLQLHPAPKSATSERPSGGF